MAEGADNEDKTESPSDKRLREAREKGDLPRSRDLSTAVVVLAGVATLIASRDQMSMHAANIMHVGLRYGRDDLFAANGLYHALMTAVMEGFWMLAPVFIATMIASVAAPTLMGGLNFSFEALIPKFDRLDPIKGFGRLVSLNGLVELGKSVLKLILIGGTLVWFLRKSTTEMYMGGTGPVAEGIARAFGIFGHASLIFAVALGAVALVDAPWQKYSFTKKMKMTKQEVKDEHKESEGSPELKSKVRQMQHQMARRRMMEDVPTADVIVTNPTHFAVALKYDENRMGAPRVVAKGVDVLAQQIRDVAGGAKIPVVEAPPLARALYATTEIGREIPSALYVAVAQILAYVFRLKQAIAMGDLPPELPKQEIDPDLLGPYRMDN
ncbi:MAG: flagellar biosynthesis protein FlhB [Luteibacter sp.]|uniref:flagellar biosynthesis protein FlhB n=1 Tax=Rhodanobacteraceae TaxID=1775411 RepID=UPI000887088C|nr:MULTISPECIES: flagellar biosynthesis protein FlhB [Rhodanobacteraceae]MDQ7997031.1 flagellar biosynthesis protein FlhB [Luteibacter sp.]MDQ8050898.1 flagellar biosynthesis protein FlhB [Luteibacter sp.]MDR6643255.1 flagellar biosynthetic protein FlhB [Luteibacter sp. 1214]SDF10169.1 flagellar biosynthetic protein FlhB [Dyella sp. 333MFSha]SKB92339.1 flagellar biosynthetic protein FlhB [Luteibacter sp. 22Crub2.1]